MSRSLSGCRCPFKMVPRLVPFSGHHNCSTPCHTGSIVSWCAVLHPIGCQSLCSELGRFDDCSVRGGGLCGTEAAGGGGGEGVGETGAVVPSVCKMVRKMGKVPGREFSLPMIYDSK